MTNAQIIFNQRVELMKAGLIKATGKKITVKTVTGEKNEIDEPEEIHTFAAWKTKGYKVKKGEHAKAKFTIWKYAGKVEINEDGEEEEKDGRCFMKLAHFFTIEQVEKIA